ncbi:cold-shock protein [Jannaschia pagri]|uniref:Cold-shock protein n=1 Tax=Jannaschia pagri TaxID=2829797 RepID=A0ABQ4NN20_9RHOB|nr:MULTISPECIES: cold shock domain-containing protein [unclassified Jannaschia]GIT91962.1 cold-shock protein [Jannaschia sp. AI_61]GIT95796.1 cold-shock protein [Jannaschia sp. AI_62]
MTGGIARDTGGHGENDQVVEGRVKWFDATRGFGFIVSPQTDRDVLLHANVLRNYGQSSVADGSDVSVRIQTSERGLQAVEVLSLVAPDPVDVAYVGTEQPEYLQPIPEDLPYQPARVKWFDKAKGFGFANVFGKADDIFIHAEVLRRFGLADLTPGEAVCLRATMGARGLLALEVRRWEYYQD